MNRFSAAVAVIMLAIFVAMVGVATTYPEKARFMPFVVGIPGIGLCLLQLALELRSARRTQRPAAGSGRGERHQPGEVASTGGPASIAAQALDAPSLASEIRTWIYFLAYIGGVLLFGLHVAVPILVATYLFLEARLSALVAGLSAAGFTVAMYLMFERLLEFKLHEGFLTGRLIDALAF